MAALLFFIYLLHPNALEPEEGLKTTTEQEQKKPTLEFLGEWETKWRLDCT